MNNTRAPLTAAISLALLASTTGCLFGEVQGIPCFADGDCPTTYFCDIPAGECREVSDQEGIPALEIKKVRDASGDVVLLPRVPAGATTTLGLQVKNVGAGPADHIGVTFSPLECAAFEVKQDTVPAVLPKGATAEINVDVTTGGDACASVKIIDWFLGFSGRQTFGTFDMDILQ